MESWEGTYKAGSEHECAESRAQSLAAEGFVRIQTAAPVEAAAPILSTRPKRKAKPNSSHD